MSKMTACKLESPHTHLYVMDEGEPRRAPNNITVEEVERLQAVQEEVHILVAQRDKLREVLAKAGAELDFINKQKLTARSLDDLVKEIGFCLGGAIAREKVAFGWLTCELGVDRHERNAATAAPLLRSNGCACGDSEAPGSHSRMVCGHASPPWTGTTPDNDDYKVLSDGEWKGTRR